MKILHTIGLSVFQIISFLFVVAFCLGLLNTHFSDKNDYCVMTYMFEYPQFVRISVPENRIYPQYGLFAYSEGRFTERARKMWFDGVPVLFLPGNSGSHQQARSLASVALRKALSKGYDYHFDFFTISYNEDLSGLYGGVLQSETEFAAACISKILSLYKSNKYTKTVPSTVILIGHSMGGLIAKRLLAYPSTQNTTSIAITLAAPLEAPVVNFDVAMDHYYMVIEQEWKTYVKNKELEANKLLLSFGNGARDVLVPSGLTSSSDSFISALTTAIPGVWVSPDHVSIVWCKQLVMAINKFMFAAVDPMTQQVNQNKEVLMSRALQYFQANRSVTLNPNIRRANVTMASDAFWYEDNRRNYQIARPEIDKITYLMIRLVSFPQNRFVAIESVNVDDNDWIFGCNAKFASNSYRYCKEATSLTELSRWTSAAEGFGKRKLATVHLHDLMEKHPDWSHVVVKVSPTRKPMTLNVDINDHASRQVTVDLPYSFSLAKYEIIKETAPNALYYELLLPGFNTMQQAYLLYVEPTSNCKASQYHVSAEVHVPWAKNHEYYHYFTELKRTPMKLRLFRSSPIMNTREQSTEYVKITLLLDKECTYTISISGSWYHRLAQLARSYYSILVPYIAAIILLAARSVIKSLNSNGQCVSFHTALMSEDVKPYYILVFGKLVVVVVLSVPLLSFVLHNSGWRNQELQYFTQSLLIVPAYMTALGLVNISAAAMLVVMVFSSQLAHRLLFRIMWRGGTGLAEKVASGLQKVPLVVSSALILSVPLSCGAASLAAGAAFYAFMISKMYEEYLEDYVYKLMAKIGSYFCRFFNIKKRNDLSKPHSQSSTSLVKMNSELPSQDSGDVKLKTLRNTESKENEIIMSNDSTIEKLGQSSNKALQKSNKETRNLKTALEACDMIASNKENQVLKTSLNTSDKKPPNETLETNLEDIDNNESTNEEKSDGVNKGLCDVDEDLSNLNFHTMMFFMWVIVTIVNVPVLLTWARNFKHSMVLKPDTSYHVGLLMSFCSAYIWQTSGPRNRLSQYEKVSSLLFVMAVFILALGPFSLHIVNYGVTIMFTIITVQQLCDKQITSVESRETENEEDSQENSKDKNEEPITSDSNDKNKQDEKKNEEAHSEQQNGDCVCNESRIYNIFKNLREKFSFTEEL